MHLIGAEPVAALTPNRPAAGQYLSLARPVVGGMYTEITGWGRFWRQ